MSAEDFYKIKETNKMLDKLRELWGDKVSISVHQVENDAIANSLDIDELRWIENTESGYEFLTGDYNPTDMKDGITRVSYFGKYDRKKNI